MPGANPQFDKYRTVVFVREARHECDQQQSDRNDHPDQPPALTSPAAPAREGRLRLPRRPAFALALATVVAMMVGASAPSPFYPVLQAEIGFSAGTMTTIFGVYALTLLATLLVTGSLSDHIGRRPVLATGFAVLAVSMVGFWHADGVASC